MFRYFIAYHVGLRIFDFLKSYEVKSYFDFLRKNELWSSEQLNNYKVSKLKKLLKYAYKYVPFYQRRFNVIGLRPDDIKGIEDLKEIPPLTRQDLQNYHSEMFSSKINPESCYRGSSSGSTGEPVVYYQDNYGCSAGLGALYYGWTLSGWRFGDKMLSIWGNPTTVNIDWKRTSSKVKAMFFNEIKYPAYLLSGRKKFEEAVILYESRNIDYIQGYTNAVFQFADFIKKNVSNNKKCKGVFTTAENLQEFQREVIEETLGPVSDFYGCGEIMGIAFQCKKRNKYHIIEPHVIVEYGEILDDQGSCELMITDLDNFGMPLIRYKNGDAGLIGRNPICDCGHPFMTFEKIIGRVSDIIKCPGGETFTVPSFLGTGLMKELKGLKQYQVERVEKDKLIIKLAVGKAFDSFDLEKVSKAMLKYIPGSMRWDIQICERIEPEKNGKYKLLIDRTEGQ